MNFNDWLPYLSEQWATTYLQILFGLMVFALGIPTLAFELVVQEDVRHVVQQRWHLKMWLALVFILFISSIAFVWLLHPLQKEAKVSTANGQQTQSGAQSQRSASGAPDENAADGGLAPDRTRNSQAGGAEAPVRQEGEAAAAAAGNNKASGRIWERWEWNMSVAAAVLLTLVPTLTFVGGWILFDRCRRVKVVTSVAKSLRHAYQTRKVLDETDLEDLIYLGTHGKAGRQKNLVLDVIDVMAAEVQAQRSDYNGSELEDLIRGIESILRYESHCGNDENFTRVATILKNIWFRLSQHNYAYSSDATATLDALKVLGIFAVKHRSEPTALIYVEEAAACDSDILFEMGVAALQARHFFIASAALVKLESLASQILEQEGGDLSGGEPPVQARDSPLEVKSNLVGLLAHFAMAGVSARRRALLSFHTNAGYFTPTRAAAFDEAFEYHYNMGRFETSDKVFALPKLLGRGDGVPDWKAEEARTF
ncbi:MAG: hypothetical protein QOD28_456 [Acidobacteriota bacterium]|nr:hypothetical protein [Acidobacteriota bacterium]